MLFGSPGRYTNPRSGHRDPHTRSRLVALGVFMVLVVACLALAPSLLRIFQLGSSTPDTAMIPVENDTLEPGEVQVNLKNLSGIEEFDAEVLGSGEVIDPLRPPGPFEENPDVLASVIDDIDGFDREGLEYLFHRIRSQEDWSNADGEWSYGKSTEFWQQAIRQPGKLRGEPLVVEGTLVSPEKGEFPCDLHGFSELGSSGVSKFYSAFLFNGSKFFRVAFFTPPDFDLADRSRVRMKGLFLHLYQNDVVHAGAVRKASVPVLVGSELTPLPPRTTPRILELIGPSALLLLGLFCAVLVVCFVIFNRGHKRYSQELEATRERLGTRKRPVFPARSAPRGEVGDQPAASE